MNDIPVHLIAEYDQQMQKGLSIIREHLEIFQNSKHQHGEIQAISDTLNELLTNYWIPLDPIVIGFLGAMFVELGKMQDKLEAHKIE